jgi:hypothetical protein
LRTGFDAIDTEEEIQNRPREWKHQTHCNPAQGRPRVALEQQRMARGRNTRKRMGGDQDPIY